MAILVLILAVLSRVVPLWAHMTGGNVTMVGAGLLFFGSRLRPSQRWHALLAVALLAASDFYLTVFAYGYPFHLASYLPTWIWYAAVVLCASLWLQRRGPVRVGVAALASSTSFFLLSNGMVWLRGNMYPHTAAGLGECYVAGLPFYRNDVASTLVFATLFFLLPSTESVKELFHGHDSAAA